VWVKVNKYKYICWSHTGHQMHPLKIQPDPPLEPMVAANSGLEAVGRPCPFGRPPLRDVHNCPLCPPAPAPTCACRVRTCGAARRRAPCVRWTPGARGKGVLGAPPIVWRLAPTRYHSNHLCKGSPPYYHRLEARKLLPQKRSSV
jgi:hypothetical protein